MAGLLRPSRFHRGANQFALQAELERALRSPSIGVRCQAVALFPRLFELFPFPMVINSSFLKLMDLFRESDNYVRVRILKATEASTAHLDKIGNLDEVLRRLLSVAHSNDPLARAITLRTLACFATDAAERKDAHHAILNGLRALDDTEAAAALHAADRYCESSAAFADEASDTLVQMMRDLEVPMRVKVSVARTFRHAHHNLALIDRYQAASRRLLTDIPSAGIVRTLLAATTNVAVQSLVGVPEQIELLVRYLRTDLRVAVKRGALGGLLRLARAAPHAWSAEAVAAIRAVPGATQSTSAVAQALRVLGALAHSPACTLLLPAELVRGGGGSSAGEERGLDGPADGSFQLLPEVQACCCSEDAELAEVACTVLCHAATEVLSGWVAEACPNFTVAAVGQAVTGACNAVVLSIGRSQAAAGGTPPLAPGVVAAPHAPRPRRFLRRVAELVQHCGERGTPELMAHVELLAGELQLAVVRADPTFAGELVECLQACAQVGRYTALKQEQLTATLAAADGGVNLDPRVRVELTATLAVLLNQSGSLERAEAEAAIARAVSTVVPAGGSLWDLYSAARRLMCTGWHQPAAAVLAQLEGEVVSDHYVWWLKAVRLVAEAEGPGGDREGDGGQDGHGQLAASARSFSKAVGCLKAARHNDASCRFQIAYVQLRAETLELLGSLLTTVKDAACSDTGRVDRHTAGTLATELAGLAAEYDKLRRAHFDIDVHSDAVLKLDRDVVITAGHALLSAVARAPATSLPPLLDLPGDGRPSVGRVVADSAPLQRLTSEIAGRILSGDKQQTLDFVQQAVSRLASTTAAVPPFFFSHAAPTAVQIAVSPYPKPGQVLTIVSDSELVLRVEGFVRRPQRQTPRSIGFIEVAVSLNSVAHPKPEVLSRRVAVVKKFFSTSFLLAMPNLDNREIPVEIAINAAFCDTEGNEWAASASERFEVTLAGRQQGKRR